MSFVFPQSEIFFSEFMVSFSSPENGNLPTLGFQLSVSEILKKHWCHYVCVECICVFFLFFFFFFLDYETIGTAATPGLLC
jgi:hypothetical protein